MAVRKKAKVKPKRCGWYDLRTGKGTCQGSSSWTLFGVKEDGGEIRLHVCAAHLEPAKIRGWENPLPYGLSPGDED